MYGGKIENDDPELAVVPETVVAAEGTSVAAVEPEPEGAPVATPAVYSD